MQHALLHSGPTTASQTYNEHSEIRAVHHLSPHATPYVKSPQHDKSIPTASSSDIYRHPAEASDTELTPPTSSSRLSSQESIASGGQDSSLAAKSVNSNALHAVTLARPVEIESPSGCPIKNITAPKRTSGGEIKRVNVSTADFLKSSHGKSPGHSRTSSSLSNGTNVAEVC